MRVVKSVTQNYSPQEDVLELLAEFRLMSNDCIRIGVRENVTSMKSLSLKAYHQLTQYDLATCYRLAAVSKVAGILRNYRKSLRRNPNTRIPHVKKLFLIDCYAFKIQGKKLRLTLRTHQYAYFDLNPHVLRVISGHTPRSVTLTTRTLSIAFSKEIDEMELKGLIGIDRNLDNVTIAASDGEIVRYNLGRATEVRARCRETKRHFVRNDARIRQTIFSKYGEIERNKVHWILHNVSSSIVNRAKAKKFGIVMENIKGIRKLYRKGNGQGTDYRAMMNSWSYHEVQRQIEYKARWEGISVVYVDARGTSANCSICGSKTYPNGQRVLFCPNCKSSFDRDENAAKNILAKGGLRFGPDGRPTEAVMGIGTTARSLGANGSQSAHDAKS